MKFIADEGVDRPIVERLRALGHNVYYAAESVSIPANLITCSGGK